MNLQEFIYLKFTPIAKIYGEGVEGITKMQVPEDDGHAEFVSASLILNECRSRLIADSLWLYAGRPSTYSG